MEFIAKSALSMALLYGVYFFCFRNETWFRLQRIYLLFALAVSVLISYADLSVPQFLPTPPTMRPIIEITNFEFGQMATPAKIPTDRSFAWDMVWKFIYVAGVVFFSVRLLLIIRTFQKLKKQHETITYNGHRVVLVDQATPSFSFGGTIYMACSDFSSTHAQSIFDHEKAHVYQRHSADLLFAELIHVLLWFNPFVKLFIHAIKQVHEYLADEAVLRSGTNKTAYSQLLLTQCALASNTAIASSFSSHIKKRIVMIAKIKSSKFSQIKLLIALPVLGMLAFLFSCAEHNVGENAASGSEATSVPQATQAESQSVPRIFPVSGVHSITSSWGTRIHPILKVEKHHSGCDIKADTGTPVVATANGVVAEIPATFTQGKGYGRYITIDHGNGYMTRYAQLSDYNVSVGQQISEGDIIGYVGSSGTSTGPHLHYEVLVNGKDTDPEKYF